MRFLVTFVLSLCLSSNAAFAIGTDLCDALAGSAGDAMHAAAPAHGEHFGHHEHAHDHALSIDEKSSPDDSSAQLAHSDHCHPHQCFTSVTPSNEALPTVTGTQQLSLGPVDQLHSIPESRLERPPRVALA